MPLLFVQDNRQALGSCRHGAVSSGGVIGFRSLNGPMLSNWPPERPQQVDCEHFGRRILSRRRCRHFVAKSIPGVPQLVQAALTLGPDRFDAAFQYRARQHNCDRTVLPRVIVTVHGSFDLSPDSRGEKHAFRHPLRMSNVRNKPEACATNDFGAHQLRMERIAHVRFGAYHEFCSLRGVLLRDPPRSENQTLFSQGLAKC